ncbi:hypothetical protein ACQY0O_003489 [Thecaphora frezii]
MAPYYTDYWAGPSSSPELPSPFRSLESSSPSRHCNPFASFHGRSSPVALYRGDAQSLDEPHVAEWEAAKALCCLSGSTSAPTMPRDGGASWASKIGPPGPPTLYHSSVRIKRAQYVTAYDPRGYLPVFEYTIPGNQVVMIDAETSYVRFTGIWKALGHAKADLSQLQEEMPEMLPYIRKIRGGFLKIQGTWLPLDMAKELSRRVAFAIRDNLVPLFGPNFPASCLRPGERGYGRLLLSDTRTRAGKRPRNAPLSSYGPPTPIDFWPSPALPSPSPSPSFSSASSSGPTVPSDYFGPPLSLPWAGF